MIINIKLVGIRLQTIFMIIFFFSQVGVYRIFQNPYTLQKRYPLNIDELCEQ